MHKDILYLISSNLKFKKISKDRLFYDQFEYCISFHLAEVSCLRELDHERIDDNMTRRKAWRDISRQRWQNGAWKVSTQMRRTWKEITQETVDDLHQLTGKLLSTDAVFKLVVSANQAWIYSNNLDLVNDINNLDILTNKKASYAQITRPKNTLRLKNSQYKFRSYFRMIKLTVSQKQHLTDFLQNQQQFLRISPALTQWINQPFNRTQDHFFVDHDSINWITMLALVLPGAIRKTVQIVSGK